MPSSRKAEVALLGATGAIGGTLSSALSARGTPYRVVGRDEAKLRAEFGADPLAEIVTWNPDDPASIRTALSGVSAAVHMVGVPYDRFALHPVLMKRVVDAAVVERVDRVLLIGTLYVFGRARAPRITEDHPRDPHTYKGRKRKEQEDILMTAPLKAAILRLPDFYGPGVASSLLHDVFVAAAQDRRANVIGPVDVPHEFVFVPDVGPVAARMLETPDAFGRAWNLAGVGTISEREIAALAFAPRKPRLRVANKLMLRLLGLFNPLMRELVEMNYLMTDPLIVDDAALTGLIGPIAKTSYVDGVARCVEAAKASLQQPGKKPAA